MANYAISLIHPPVFSVANPVGFQVIAGVIWAFGYQATAGGGGGGLPIVFSSSDGGSTWVEADPTHRPSLQAGNSGFANPGVQLYDPVRSKFVFSNSRVFTTTSRQAFWEFDLGSGLYANGGVVASTLIVGGNPFGTGADANAATTAALTYFADGSYVLMLQNISSFTSVGPNQIGSPVIQYRSTDGGATWGSSSIITTTPAPNTFPEPNPHYNVVSIVPTSPTDYVGLLAIISQPDGLGGRADPMYYVTGTNTGGVSSYTLIPGTNVTYTQSAFQQRFVSTAQPTVVYVGGTTSGGNAHFSLNYSDDAGVTYSPGTLTVTAGPTLIFTKISPSPANFINTGIALNHLGAPVMAYGFGSSATSAINESLFSGTWGPPSAALTPPNYGAAPPAFADYGTPHNFYDVYFPQPFVYAGGDYTGVLVTFDSFFYYAGVVLPYSVGPAITCGDPPSGIVGVPYTHTLPVSGGTPPYTFSLISGALPAGLTLDTATGIISGTPTVAEHPSFTVRVTDAGSNTADVTCSITIYITVGCSITVGATVPVPIHNIWESGLARGNELSATMIRLAGADVWVRGAGPLDVTVYGPDKVLSQNPQLLLASGVPAVALDPNPGIMYALKLDFRQIENFTIRYETNTLDAWFELSGFRTYTKSDLFNR